MHAFRVCMGVKKDALCVERKKKMKQFYMIANRGFRCLLCLVMVRKGKEFHSLIFKSQSDAFLNIIIPGFFDMIMTVSHWRNYIIKGRASNIYYRFIDYRL